MPVRNGSAYLSAAIESVLTQSFADFEFLILDDGSTDESPSVLQSYARRDPRIRLMSREKRGLTATLNELLYSARGELIARIDADDIAAPGRFARQLQFLLAHPQVLCVGGAFDLIDEAGRFLTTLYPPTSDEQIQRQLLRGHCAINHPTVMARLRPVLEVGAYQCDLVEDHDLWLRLGERGQLANLSEVLLRYRVHAASVSQQAGMQQRTASRAVCERAWLRRHITDGVYEGGAHWRPGPDRASQYEFMLRYGWWAWNSRQRVTAQLYATKAIRARPLGMEGWKLLLVSLLKPFDSELAQPSRG
jgi:glycosyltransferase involved in cell wall biosynthesis